jgi:hypothetical protein
MEGEHHERHKETEENQAGAQTIRTNPARHGGKSWGLQAGYLSIRTRGISSQASNLEETQEAAPSEGDGRRLLGTDGSDWKGTQI